jgi:hypothetical protein
MPSGVRIKAMRHHAADQDAAGHEGVAGVVDVVHSVGEMPECAHRARRTALDTISNADMADTHSSVRISGQRHACSRQGVQD